GAPARQPAHLRAPAHVRRRHRPVRAQPRALRASRPARSLPLGGNDAGRDVRPDRVPADRRAALLAYDGSAGVLLVPVEEGRVGMTDEHQLIGFVRDQRWFGSKSRTVSHATVIDRATLRDTDPQLELQLIEIRFD